MLARGMLLVVLSISFCACTNKEAEGGALGLNRTFTCSEALPSFTLGPDSNPTPAELRGLCSCVWQGLSKENQKLSPEIGSVRWEAIPTSERKRFTYAFSAAIERCGGMDI